MLSRPRQRTASEGSCRASRAGRRLARAQVSQATNAPPADLAVEASAAVTIDFALLYNEYFRRVFAYLYRRVQDKELAADLVAEVFERAFLAFNRLRISESAGGWLFTIAHNVAIAHWRKQRTASTVLQVTIEQAIREQESPEERVLEQEELQAVLKAVQTLSPREQEVLALRFDAELPGQDIARITGLSVGNVRVITYRALQKLRQQLMERGPTHWNGRNGTDRPTEGQRQDRRGPTGEGH